MSDHERSDPAPSDPVADAWEASSLNRWTAPGFYRRVEEHDAEPDPVAALAGTEAQIRLPPVDDRLQRLLSARRSGRTFAPGTLSGDAVARVLAAVGPGTGSGRGPLPRPGRRRRPAPGPRVVPSPGGLETVTAFAVGSAVEGPLAGRVARYDHRRHEIAPVAPAPPADELRRLCSLTGAGDPQLVLWWIVEPGPALDRYGPRGLRLTLQEVGHAAQNVALRLAADGLAGYSLGGVLDDEVLDVTGLTGLDVWVAGGMACGLAG